MASGSTELDSFNLFVSEKLGGDLNGLSLEEAVSEYRAYQRELGELREKLAVAEEQSARGESAPLDLDSVFERADKRLDQIGIPE